MSARTDESLHPAAEAREETAPSFWASVDPAVMLDRGNADLWRVFVNIRSTETGERVCIARIDMFTSSRGFAALAEIDAGLLASGWRRASDWQLGSGRGFVAWLDLDPMAVS